jgi:hypothetical protein
MTPELGIDRTDYHLRLMIERMQRDGRSETAIDNAVRSAFGSKRRARRAGERENHAGVAAASARSRRP